MFESPRWRTRFLPILLAGWSLLVLFYYYRRFWPHFDPAVPLIPTAWPTFAAARHIARYLLLWGWLEGLIFLLGHAFCKRQTWTFESPLVHVLTAYALGAGGLIALLFVMGVAGFYGPLSLILLFIVLSLVVGLMHLDWRPDLRRALRGVRRVSPGEGALILVLVAYLVIFLFHALTPETSYDALVYHLGFPGAWLLQHRLRLPVTYVFSGMPLNTELLYGLALALSDGILAKLVHFGFGVSALLAIYGIAAKLSQRVFALLAVLIFIATPMLSLDFAWAASDLAALFFGLMGAYALLSAVEDEQEESRWIRLSGLFVGMAMGCKYPAWILFPTFILAWVWQTRRWRAAGAFALCAAVAVLPWIIKNGVLFHNPIYPFFAQILRAPQNSLVNWDLLRSEAGRDWTHRGLFSGIGNVLREPWSSTMGETAVGGNYLGPLLLLTLPFLLAWPRGKEFSFWRKLTLLGWLISSFLSFMPRFWLPVLPIAAILAAASLAMLESRRFKIGMTVVIVSVAGLNLFWSHRFFMAQRGWDETLGRLSTEDYLRIPHAHYLSPYDPAARYLNAHAPVDAKVLLLGDTRMFYIERPCLGASLFDAQPLFVWADASADGAALYQRFQRENLHWILLNPAEAARMERYWLHQLTPHGRAVLHDFWTHHIDLVFNDEDREAPQTRADAVLIVVPQLPAGIIPPLDVLGALWDNATRPLKTQN